MRRKSICVFGLAALTLAVGAWLWLSGRSDPVANGPTKAEQFSPDTVSPEVSPTAALVSGTASHVSEPEMPKNEAIKAAFLTPISIFGQVVDDDNRPIPEAAVRISINDSPSRSGTEYVRFTDGEGAFSLVGVRGISFSVSVSKDGFYSTKQSTAHRNVIAPASSDVTASTPKNPIKLTLRRKVHPEMLLRVTSRQVPIAASGATNVDLTTGRVGDGQLRIVSIIGDPNQSRFDWKYCLSIPGGGLAERHGQFDFEAPSHYSEEIQVTMKSDQLDWSADVTKEYFARLPDGRFARFSINFYPGKRNFVVVESYVNPTPGNQNLEFGAELRSTP